MPRELFRFNSRLIACDISYQDDKINLEFSYDEAFKNEIKASLSVARWNPKNRCWSVNNNSRAKFILGYLQGKPVYNRFDLPLVDYTPSRSLYNHQIDMVRQVLTRKCAILAAEMGTGKTLAAIEFIETSQKQRWWYVAPRSALESVKRELRKWNAKVYPQLMTYEEMVKILKGWNSSQLPPEGVVFDESSRLKNPKAQRTQAALHLAEHIREYYSDEGYVVLMSGSPAPKSPWDWWSQCEIACPGFLREGSYEYFQNRVSLIKMEESLVGSKYPKLLTHKDSDKKCGVCGQLSDHELHKTDDFSQLTHVATTQNDHPADHPHEFNSMSDEISLMHKRLDGLVMVKFKKDCLDLPEKVYHEIILKPSPTLIRTAKLIAKSAPTVAQSLILLRELSDGFQYHEQLKETKKCEYCKSGKQPINQVNNKWEYRECIHCSGKGFNKFYERVQVECEIPKTDALINLLEQHEEDGRLIVYAGFTASIDRICAISRKCEWKFIRVDGRGWHSDLGPTDPQRLLDIFQDKINDYPKVCFVGHPASAGMGLTLTASKSIVYWSNDFNAESRIQSEDRIHRPGSRGANIFDLLVLPVDKLVLENLKSKREIQAITLGDIQKSMEEVQ